MNARHLVSKSYRSILALLFLAGSTGQLFAGGGFDVDVIIGSLPPGKTVNITYTTTVQASLPAGSSNISNQGTVTYTAGDPLQTDDPDGGGKTDPTLTPALNSAPAGPVANPDTIERYLTQSVKVPVATLLANDSDGGSAPITITGVTPSGSGAAVSVSGGNVFYSPNGVTTADTFAYTIENGSSATDTGTVTVNIIIDNNEAANIVGTVMTGSGPTKQTAITFAGIPGREYTIQSTDSLSPPNWVDRATVIAGSRGEIGFVDAPPPALPPTRFYRTVIK